MEDQRVSIFREKISSLFNNPRLSDIVVIESDGTEFYGHRILLSLYTNFFEAAVSSAFAESSTRTVSLPDHGPDAVRALLEVSCTGYYTFQRTPRLHLDLYSLADYIIAPEVKEMAAEGLEKVLTYPEGPFEKFWCNSLPEIVEEVFASTTSSKEHHILRKMVNERVVKGMIQKHPWEPFQKVMEKYGEFSAAVFGKYVDGMRKKYKEEVVHISGEAGSWNPPDGNLMVLCQGFRRSKVLHK